MMQTVPYRIVRPNYMGMMRYVLAMLIFLTHFCTLTGVGGNIPYVSPMAVGGFFALSGYLMAGSYLSHPGVGRYLRGRCRRILPAYWSVVLLGAVSLCAVSTLPPGEYFGSGHLWRYVAVNLGFANFLEPTLPGVFGDNAITAVNGSLWTMKVEWFLYLTIPVVIPLLRGRSSSRILLTLVAIYLLSALYRYGCTALYERTGRDIFNILTRQFGGMLMYFYAGVLVYYYYDVLTQWRWWLVGASLVSLVALCDREWYSLLVEPLAVSVVVLGVSLIEAGKREAGGAPGARAVGTSVQAGGGAAGWRLRYLVRDNISYNIYLIHFPVMQVAAQYRLTETLGVAATFGITLAATVLLSYLINICVERPILRL